MQWINDFRCLFIESVSELPEAVALAFSGGVESSAILFAMMELGRPPRHCITFTVDHKPTKDLPYAREICRYYDVPLTVVNIPKLKKAQLEEDITEILRIIGIARNIDIQCCHIFRYFLRSLRCKNLVTGFYEDIHYEANAKVSIMYRRMKKGLVSEEDFDKFYRYGRWCIYNGVTKYGYAHNYVVIERFLASQGIYSYHPFKTEKLFSLTQSLTFEDTCYKAGKFKKKWFITDVMFEKEFAKFRNAKNSNNMHTQGMKQYHREVLLEGTTHKDTKVVYNKLLKNLNKKNSPLKLFE